MKCREFRAGNYSLDIIFDPLYLIADLSNLLTLQHPPTYDVSIPKIRYDAYLLPQ